MKRIHIGAPDRRYYGEGRVFFVVDDYIAEPLVDAVYRQGQGRVAANLEFRVEATIHIALPEDL